MLSVSASADQRPAIPLGSVVAATCAEVLADTLPSSGGGDGGGSRKHDGSSGGSSDTLVKQLSPSDTPSSMASSGSGGGLPSLQQLPVPPPAPELQCRAAVSSLDGGGPSGGAGGPSAPAMSPFAAPVQPMVVGGAPAMPPIGLRDGGGLAGGSCAQQPSGPPPAASAVKLEPWAPSGSGGPPKAEGMPTPPMLPGAADQPGVPRRVIANRQSAARSKERRRGYVIGLEQSVKRLTLQINEQQSHLHSLASNSATLCAPLSLSLLPSLFCCFSNWC